MALSTDREIETMFPGIGYIAPCKVASAITLFKGALVNFDANGVLVKAADVAGQSFAGLVKEKVVGTVAGVDVEVIRNTVAWLPKADAAAGDVGKFAYATGDDTVTVAAAANVKACGRVVAWKTGFVLIDFADRHAA